MKAALLFLAAVVAVACGGKVDMDYYERTSGWEYIGNSTERKRDGGNLIYRTTGSYGSTELVVVRGGCQPQEGP